MRATHWKIKFTSERQYNIRMTKDTGLNKEILYNEDNSFANVKML